MESHHDYNNEELDFLKFIDNTHVDNDEQIFLEALLFQEPRDASNELRQPVNPKEFFTHSITKDLMPSIGETFHNGSDSAFLCEELFSEKGMVNLAVPAQEKKPVAFPKTQIVVAPPQFYESEESDDEPIEIVEPPRLELPRQNIKVSRPKSRPAPRPAVSRPIKNNTVMKTSHTVRELVPLGEALFCQLLAKDTKDTCGQLYHMANSATGDWSHTLCRKIIGDDGKVKYKACEHYSFCMLCDPKSMDHQCKPYWNRSKYYNHRSKKHSHLVYRDGWEEDSRFKDGGLCARVNHLARELGYYRHAETELASEAPARPSMKRPRF